MTSVRIIAPEAHLDTTIDLDESELSELLDVIHDAEWRADLQRRQREAKARMEAEAAEKLRRLRDSFHAFPANGSVFTGWTSGLRGASTAFTGSPLRTTAGPGVASRPRTPVTVTDALDVISWYSTDAYRKNREEMRALLRKAKRKAHPDTGGTSADFQLVTAAEDILRRAGRI